MSLFTENAECTPPDMIPPILEQQRLVKLIAISL